MFALKHVNFWFLVLIILLICTIFFSSNKLSSEKAEITHPVYEETPSHNEQVKNFLLMGKDQASGLCDVIIIVSYDTKFQKIVLIYIISVTVFIMQVYAMAEFGLQ